MAWLGDLGSALLGALYANAALAAAVGGIAVVVLGLLARRLGWIGAARRHPRLTGAIVAVGLAVALPIGWHLASPLVLTSSIDEPAPTVASRSIEPSATPAPTEPVPSRGPVPSGAPATSPPPTPTPTPALIESSGVFHGSDDFHFGRGTARLIEIAPGSFVVRLEDFAVRNGPDLYVYLSPNATGYDDAAIELGKLKADRGNQNYAVPSGALSDPTRAASVVIWCKQFSHLFATAPLTD